MNTPHSQDMQSVTDAELSAERERDMGLRNIASDPAHLVRIAAGQQNALPHEWRMGLDEHGNVIPMRRALSTLEPIQVHQPRERFARLKAVLRALWDYLSGPCA